MTMLFSKSIPQKSISTFVVGPGWEPLPWVIGSSCKTKPTFSRKNLSLHNNTDWPLRSPDLTPCNFFLWGYFKEKVFRTPPESLNVLRQKIKRECNLPTENRDLIRRSV